MQTKNKVDLGRILYSDTTGKKHNDPYIKKMNRELSKTIIRLKICDVR